MPAALPAATSSTLRTLGHQSGHRWELRIAAYTASSGASICHIVSKQYSAKVIQAFFAHKLHQPLALILPSTSLQLFDAAMKCAQPLHLCSPFGSVWYCTLAGGSFLVAAGGAESAPLAAELNRVIGTIKLQPAANAPRSTNLRDEISFLMVHAPSR